MRNRIGTVGKYVAKHANLIAGLAGIAVMCVGIYMLSPAWSLIVLGATLIGLVLLDSVFLPVIAALLPKIRKDSH